MGSAKRKEKRGRERGCKSWENKMMSWHQSAVKEKEEEGKSIGIQTDLEREAADYICALTMACVSKENNSLNLLIRIDVCDDKSFSEFHLLLLPNQVSFFSLCRFPHKR
jgi:hypothetical protein